MNLYYSTLFVFSVSVSGAIAAFVANAPKKALTFHHGRRGSNGAAASGTTTSVFATVETGTTSSADNATIGPASEEDSAFPVHRSAAPSSLASTAPAGPAQSSDPGAASWKELDPVKVQGGTLKTFLYASPSVERVKVVLRTEGRPLDADVVLWQGPDFAPTKLRVYVEDGKSTPFSTVIETPRGPNTVAVRNIGSSQFPLDACVSAASGAAAPSAVTQEPELDASQTVQGGSLKTYVFDSNVDSVQILLKTDGRPLNARVHLFQGPNNYKQAVDITTEDGMDHPFFMILETPGGGNTLKVINRASVEFPFTASVAPYKVDADYSPTDALMDGA